MKNLKVLAAVLALAVPGVFAATASDQFDVTITFTSACKVKTAAADFTFTYTAFGAAQTQTGATVFECSRGLTPTFRFDDTSADQTGQAAAVALGTAITGEGLISGVRYTVGGTSSKTVTGTAAAAGAGGIGGTNGTADEYNVALSVTVPQQAGGSGIGGTQTRTLFITY